MARGPEEVCVVAFRGTDAGDPVDLGEDADFVLVPWPQGGKVHKGFARALNVIRSGLERVIPQTGGKLLLTGHSLGAALATLFASARHPDGLYTFGSPRVGDSAFVATLDSVPNDRYVDCSDLITHLPPEILGYAHAGAPLFVDSERRVIRNPDPGVVAADQAQARARYLLEQAWRKGTVGLRDLADHAPINYVWPVVANLV